MNWVRVMILVYGVINFLGGTMGFVMTGSIESVIAGGVFGVLLVLCALFASKAPALCYRGAGVLALLLLLFWANRLNVVMQAGESPMMPAGNLGLAALVIVLLVVAHFAGVKNTRSAS